MGGLRWQKRFFRFKESDGKMFLEYWTHLPSKGEMKAKIQITKETDFCGGEKILHITPKGTLKKEGMITRTFKLKFEEAKERESLEAVLRCLKNKVRDWDRNIRKNPEWLPDGFPKDATVTI